MQPDDEKSDDDLPSLEDEPATESNEQQSEPAKAG